MSKIDRLTPEQARELPLFRERRRQEALSTEPIDPEQAQASVRALYKAAGLTEPGTMLVLGSPKACLLVRDALRKLGDQLRSQLSNQLEEQLMDQLSSQLNGQLWPQLREQLGNQLWDQLRSQLSDQLEAQLRDQLGGQLFQAVFSGGWAAYWLAVHEFARHIGVRYKPETEARFEAYLAYSRTCGVAHFYPQIAFVSDRPEKISFDAARRLHCADGPALRYRDGYALYSWKGIRVEPEVIEQRSEITPERIRNESNAELRRVLMEVYSHVHGPGRAIADMGAKLLAEDECLGLPRKLYDINGARYVHVVNGTLEPDGSRREFLLGAHPDAKTPHEAIAASYGVPADKYREAVRT